MGLALVLWTGAQSTRGPEDPPGLQLAQEPGVVTGLIGSLGVALDGPVAFFAEVDAFAQARTARCEEAARSDPRYLPLCQDELLRQAYLTYRDGDAWSVAVGRKRLLQGGFAQKSGDEEKVLPNPYLDFQLPLPDSQAAFEATFGDAVALQVTDDVTTEASSRGVFEDAHHQPALLAEVRHRSGTFSSLLQAQLYDLNKSHAATLGVAWRHPALAGSLDLTRDDRAQKIVEEFGAATPSTILTQATLVVEGLPDGVVRPFVKVARLEVRQAPGGRRVNTFGFDDDGQSWTIGSWYGVPGDAWKAMFSYGETTGRFASGTLRWRRFMTTLVVAEVP